MGSIGSTTLADKQRAVSTAAPFDAAVISRQAEYELNHRLGANETGVSVEGVTPHRISYEDNYVEYKVDYSVNMRIPIGADPETGIMEYDYDTEYRSQVMRFKLR